ncbi:MAG: cupin domain-containing protein [Nitrosomonadales bacterium]|nr:cupin domain-containing protein [Nitrosomonadales bacterium]
MTKPILNIADAELLPRPPGFAPTGEIAERYDARIARVSAQLGAQKLGYNITSVPPGKRAFPPHSHRFNEEMFMVLEGAGEVTIGKETYPIRQGDIVALLTGGPESAHVVTNTGSTELKYLAVSTRISPEICDYPTTGKFGVFAELPPSTEGKPGFFRHVGRESLAADYWEGG